MFTESLLAILVIHVWITTDSRDICCTVLHQAEQHEGLNAKMFFVKKTKAAVWPVSKLQYPKGTKGYKTIHCNHLTTLPHDVRFATERDHSSRERGEGPMAKKKNSTRVQIRNVCNRVTMNKPASSVYICKNCANCEYFKT